MKKLRNVAIAVLITAFVLSWAPRTSQAALGPFDQLSPEDATTDGYGYNLALVVDPGQWVELGAHNATKIDFPSRDDSFAGPFTHFPFKYYENTYSNFYVSTNGIITFGSGSWDYFARPIPFSPAPNNLIAPLWGDLYKNTYGQVFYRVDGTAGSRRLVVEWEIYNNASLELLITNFEVILYEATGNIRFHYNRLNSIPDWYSVGIEDANGINGLQYQIALTPGQGLLFTRPALSYRVNLVPRIQGGFTANGEANFPIKVINNGERGADNYNLQVSPVGPSWTAQFYDNQGNPLTDTNADGKVDTGALAQGDFRMISLKVKPPAGATAGVNASFTVTATSIASPGKLITAVVQTAVPSAFAQVYVDQWGIRMGQYWNANTIEWPIQEGFSGSNLSMESSDDNYLAAWEYLTTIGADGQVLHGVTRAEDDSLSYRGEPLTTLVVESYTDIKYKIINRVTGTSGLPLTLTNGAALIADPSIYQADARTPALAAAANGNVAVAWSWLLRAEGPVYKSNVYLGLVGPTGNVIVPAYNVTSDTVWYPSSHQYDLPQVTYTPDGRYVVCWNEGFSNPPAIGCGFHTISGQNFTRQGALQRFGAIAGMKPLHIFTTNLSNNRVLVTYTESYIGVNSVLVFSVFNSSGSVSKGRTVVEGATGSRARAVQFANGNVLIAWIEEDGRVGYRYFNSSFTPLSVDPVYLPKVNQRNAGNLSITLDLQGRAVLTWVDVDDFDYMFYALLGHDQTVLTPPMMFISDPFGNPMLQTSAYGFGNASYSGVFRNFTPLVSR